jgi:hypothetical protein
MHVECFADLLRRLAASLADLVTLPYRTHCGAPGGSVVRFWATAPGRAVFATLMSRLPSSLTCFRAETATPSVRWLDIKRRRTYPTCNGDWWPLVPRRFAGLAETRMSFASPVCRKPGAIASSRAESPPRDRRRCFIRLATLFTRRRIASPRGTSGVSNVRLARTGERAVLPRPASVVLKRSSAGWTFCRRPLRLSVNGGHFKLNCTPLLGYAA